MAREQGQNQDASTQEHSPNNRFLSPKRIRVFSFLSSLALLLNGALLSTYLSNLISYFLDDGIDGRISASPDEVDLTAPNAVPTLVLLEPFFLGGFRNQHMRFVAFVHFATERNISQILLPSIRWGDKAIAGRSAAHEQIFDVQFWNQKAKGKGLPRLVRYDPNVLEGVVGNYGAEINQSIISCWNQTSNLYTEIDEDWVRHPETNIRKFDLMRMIGTSKFDRKYSHCSGTFTSGNDVKRELQQEMDRRLKLTNITSTIQRFTYLIPFGGGLRAGRLWRHYESMQKERNIQSNITIGNETHKAFPEHSPVEKAMYQILRPTRPIVSAIQEAIYKANEAASKDSVARNNYKHWKPRLLALHPRVEKDMLRHAMCSQHMEPNLTKVFERLITYPLFLRSGDDFRNTNRSSVDTTEFTFDLIFIAISRNLIVDSPGTVSRYLGEVMQENLAILDDVTQNGLLSTNGARVPVYESGKSTATRVKFPVTISSVGNSSRPDVALELIASIIDFFTAVTADVFVGVKGSSYSTDIMTARYYQGQGGENYIIGRKGIERVFGVPGPHGC